MGPLYFNQIVILIKVKRLKKKLQLRSHEKKTSFWPGNGVPMRSRWL